MPAADGNQVRLRITWHGWSTFDFEIIDRAGNVVEQFAGLYLFEENDEPQWCGAIIEE